MFFLLEADELMHSWFVSKDSFVFDVEDKAGVLDYNSLNLLLRALFTVWQLLSIAYIVFYFFLLNYNYYLNDCIYPASELT